MPRPPMAFISCLLFVFAACGAVSAQGHPHTIDKSVKADFNGTWVDDAGREWELAQDQGYLKLTSKAGAVFEGHINGRNFDTVHSLTYPETRKNLPPEIRRMITGEQVVMRGTLSDDGETISATYIDKDPDWLYYQDTNKYVIKEMRDGNTPLTLHRPAEIHIGKIRVDYELARQRINEIQSKINDLDTELQSLAPLLTEAQARYDTALPPYRAAQAAIREIEKQITAAQPNPSVQMQIDYLTELKFFQDLRDAGANASDAHQRDLLTEAITKKNALLKQLKAKGIKMPLSDQKSSAQLQAMIDALEKTQGIDKKALYALEDQLIVAQGAKDKAESEFDLAADSVNRLSDRLYPAMTEKERLEKQIAVARKEGDAQLTGVDVTGASGVVYSATWSDPWDHLQEVNGDIKQIDDSLEGARHSEDMLHNAYVEAQANEAALGKDVETAIWKSMWAQYGIEVTDLVGDMVKNSLEEGVHVGILHAVGKKFFDCGKDVIWAKGDFGAIGGYEFMDEEKIRQEMLAGGTKDKIDPEKEWDELVKADGKELANTGGTKLVLQVVPKTKDVVKFVAERSKLAEEIVIKSGTAGAKQATRRAVDGLFKEVALKRAGSDMALDIFKDYAKGKLKEGARETFEGDAWRDYFNAEFYRQALHQQWMGAVARVHGLERFRAKLQFVHDEILKDYEQNDLSHYKGTEASALRQKKEYTSHLKFKGAQPSKLDVHFGNAVANCSGNDCTFNTGTAKGTVDMYVNVLEY